MSFNRIEETMKHNNVILPYPEYQASWLQRQIAECDYLSATESNGGNGSNPYRACAKAFRALAHARRETIDENWIQAMVAKRIRECGLKQPAVR